MMTVKYLFPQFGHFLFNCGQVGNVAIFVGSVKILVGNVAIFVGGNIC